ncbi:MAG: GAF domain-containing sensor histidine kinase [Ilumatobacteraceae bacterium]
MAGEGHAPGPRWSPLAPAPAMVDRRRPAPLRPVPNMGVQAPPLAPFRWAALAVSFIHGFPRITDKPWPYAAVFAVLVVYTTTTTVRPIPYRSDRSTRTLVSFDAVLHLTAVMLTGNWNSPFAYTLLPSTLLAGFAAGPLSALELMGACAGVISLRHLTEEGIRSGGARAAAWAGVLALISLTSGLARRVSEESARQQLAAEEKVDRLSEANALLFSLQRVAQSLPDSLDLDEVLDTTVARVRSLIDADAVTVLLYSEADRSWDAVRTKGYRGSYSLRGEELPPALREALLSSRTISIDDLNRPGSGLSDNARSGLYAPLRARGSLVGLLAVEANRPTHFVQKHSDTLNSVIETFGIAIDNARLFRRLRSVGADEERSRIARELHDRIGSSLALLGFEVDRLTTLAKRGEAVHEPLADLRQQVTTVVSEVRETLYDLRTDVSEGQGLEATLRMFCERVGQRTSMDVVVTTNEKRRLHILQERELWQIAREAITNAERHAHADTLTVSWNCTNRGAELVVADDGKGFTKGSGRPDSYGLLGMRERAASVNAVLDIESGPGAGTKVRVTLGSETGGRS